MHKIREKSNVDHNKSFLCDLRWNNLTHWQIAIAHGEAAFCVTDFPKVKFSASGKFPWIHQSDQKNYP